MHATTASFVEPGARAVITPRGAAVLAILRVQDLVRDLDAADRAYVAPLIADCLVTAATDIPEAPTA